MIVVDSSAVIAVLLNEETRPAVLAALEGAQAKEMSAANYVECGPVLAGRLDNRLEAIDILDAFLDSAEIQLVPVDHALAQEAVRARIAFGKGFGHRARLNYGDSFAYALAKARKAPLLYVGDDFTHTDIVSALA